MSSCARRPEPEPSCSSGRSPRHSNRNLLGDCFGHYLVFEELGTGGIASVHRAVDGDRTVMLKRLRPEFEADWELVAAFVQEGQLASRLAHRGIARTHACGKLEGTPYIATELVPDLRCAR